MHYLSDLAKTLHGFAGFAAYRWGMKKERPSFVAMFPQLVHAAGPIFGWPGRFRLINAHHCPAEGPVVFPANHTGVSDPAYTVKAIVEAGGGALAPSTMMRDDFFRSRDHNTNGAGRLCWEDDLMESFGGVRINRENPQLSQLRPLFTLLGEGGAFILYPNGTRTRSGMFFEYRDSVTTPGAVSFFLLQGQRRRKAPVPAVPLVRTLNLVERSNTMIFGEPMLLDPDSDRAAQQAFDHRVAEAMSRLVEANVPQTVSAALYLWALHGRPPAFSERELADCARTVFRTMRHPYVAPAAEEDLDGAVTQTLRYLRKKGFVDRNRAGYAVVAERWLAPPPADGRYAKASPAKYMVNQILHLGDVVGAIEAAALGG